jgi:L-Lysine epsilon oxidase N-terminal/L-lysine epsilon oxidase C-terminal domain
MVIEPESRSAADGRIVRAAIFPSIGVARVGSSKTGWFLGPEVPEPLPLPPGSYRDATGALKPQAARFRVYGLNASGRVVRELTTEDSEIEWTVELANKKSGWYGFQLALDIAEASSAPPTTPRNPLVSDRKSLLIRPRARTISGADQPQQHFDDGAFMGAPVYLGSIATDEAGRLVVLGGHGLSTSYNNSPAVTFANNDTWCDDTSDGPVTAKVKVGGNILPVDPAWIVVGPPNYAPCRKSVRTMWDLMRDLAIQGLMLKAPERPSFTHEILPIFQRLAGLQWVNQGFAEGFGWKGLFDLTVEVIERMAAPGVENAAWRKVVVNQFRPVSPTEGQTSDGWSPVPWPWIYGDAMNIPPPHSPRANSSLTQTQLNLLNLWAKGQFEGDYDPNRPIPRHLEDFPVSEQGDILTKAALEFCLADAFHPGCEMTWPMRQLTMYSAPFRIAHAPRDWVEPDYGVTLTFAIASSPTGCLGPQQAGGLTRWMAVPWQCDTASCRSGYDAAYDPYVPTFWPAHVPNQVLARRDYDLVMDEGLPLREREAAFGRRLDWDAPLDVKAPYMHQINQMIAHFDRMGVVESLPGPSDHKFPALIEVQDLPEQPGLVSSADLAEAAVSRTDLSGIDKVRRLSLASNR